MSEEKVDYSVPIIICTLIICMTIAGIMGKIDVVLGLFMLGVLLVGMIFLKISPAGLLLIKQFEHLELKAYLDQVGVWTIGYGHTKGVNKGLEINEETAEIFLRQDISPPEQAINSVGTLLLQNEFDALVSLVFNIGVGAFKKSTIFKLLFSKQIHLISLQFLRWNKVRINGELKVSQGLNNRRIKEKKVFEFGDYN